MAKKKRIEKKTNIIDLIPYIFIIAVVPLIVYLHKHDLDPIEVSSWKGGDVYYDLLNYCKSQWFIIASALGMCFFIFRSIQGRVRLQRKPDLYIPAAVYILFIVLSTVTSEYASVALHGFVARYEGVFVLLFYILNMFILFNLVSEEGQVRILFGSLLISAAVICLIGLSQMAGHDFFETSLGKSFILPAEYAGSELDFKFGRMVYGTLSNPNYMGSYVALVLPIAVAAIFLAKKKGLKIASAVIAVLLLINLIGSDSDAGLVGLGVGILIAVIYFRKKIFNHKIVAVLAVVVVLAGAGFVGKRVASEFHAGVQGYYVEDILFEDNTAKIISSTETLVIRCDDSALSFYDANDNQLEIDMSEAEEGEIITFKDPSYKNYTLTLFYGDILKIQDGGVELYMSINDNALSLVGNNNEEIRAIAKPEAINVKGYEKVGSARIYIWSRTIPLLKHTLLVGSGPDSFAVEFPQDDYIGKINAYGTPNMIVDKPHSLYLQIAVNTGVLSLIAFLALVLAYVINCIKLYLARSSKNTFASFGVAIFISICSYLVVGLFNDSVVSVAPIFWILLGTGFACNSMAARDINKAGPHKEQSKEGKKAHASEAQGH